MPWPEKDLTTRVLAAIAGALLGAVVGFLLGVGPFGYLNGGHPPLLTFTLVTAAISSVAGFSFGDPAIRFLLRVFGC
jgi:hypothetical protein